MECRNLGKSYGGQKVFEWVNLTFQDGGIYCLMGPSGSGKTTFFRCILGLEKPDTGEIRGGRLRFSAAFQEDRLIEFLSPVKNILLVRPQGKKDRAEVEKACGEVLPEEALSKPCSKLSGGMRRRAAVCRAMLADSEAVILDEPFAGLDEENHRKLAEWILKWRKGRLLLFSSHDPEDVKRLGAVRIGWEEL